MYKLSRVPHPNDVHDSKETALNELKLLLRSVESHDDLKYILQSIPQMGLHRYISPRYIAHATDIVTQNVR